MAGNGSGLCSISIAEQSSYAPCILGRSFGCTNAAAAERSPSVWVRGCRGRFLLRGCSGKDETSIWCGYPPGASSYNCSCAGRSTASWPRAPHLRSRRADRTTPAKTETVANAESLAALLKRRAEVARQTHERWVRRHAIFSSKMVESTDCGNGSSCSAAWARYDCNRTQRATTGRGSPLCSPLCTRASVLDLFQVVEGTSWRTHHVMRSTYGAGCVHKCNGQFGALRLSRADGEHLRMGLSCPRQPARPPRTGGELVLHYPYSGGVQTLSGNAYVKFEPLIVSRGRKAVDDGFLVWRSPFNPTPAPNYTRLEVYRIPHKREGVGYGCWFYPLLAPYSRGTGVFIDVGRTWVFQRREEAHIAFGKLGPQRDDSMWALTALRHGIDTVQLMRGPFRMPELLVASHACTNQSETIGVCPPMPLYTGPEGNSPCVCDAHSHVLRCAHVYRHGRPTKAEGLRFPTGNGS